jgi:Protein kinase domain
MNQLPSIASRLDLLKWVLAHPNQPFDPTMVVSVSSRHADGWEWRAVEAAMDQLKFDGYITQLKRGPEGTYWTITPQGESYLKALTSFEDAQVLAKTQPAVATTGSPETVRTGKWEELKPLGGGGQSMVFLVRSPQRFQEREEIFQKVRGANPWAPYAGGNPTEIRERIDVLARSLWSYARPDLDAELGALKRFKIPDDPVEAAEAISRLRNEIVVLRETRQGLVRLIDADENERWVVTELMPDGTLQDRPEYYKGDLVRALTAFRSLVFAVSGLHQDNYVHRDIKPANVFLAQGDGLLLGDFGIVFIPNQPERPTLTNERVGPRDYMPQWGDLGERLKNVHTNFDVYMLGKLLWCMVSGRLKLPREYFNRPAYDLRLIFPNDPGMHLVDEILRATVVEEPQDCLKSATELLALVDEKLETLRNGGQPLGEGVLRPCRVCGRGRYVRAQLESGVTGAAVVTLSMENPTT